jgi:DNA-binding NarL/FixJ family response regulator
MNGSKLRVMLVEDHAVLRDILTEFVGRLPDVAGCTSISSAEAALTSLDAEGATDPDLLLIDLSLPGMSGIELIKELRRAHPALRCAILSGHRSRSYAQQALDAGARGYLLKGDPGEIERGIEAIFRGERYVSKNLGAGH